MIDTCEKLILIIHWHNVALTAIHTTKLQMLSISKLQVFGHLVLSVHSKVQVLRRVKRSWEGVVYVILEGHLLVGSFVLETRC